MKNPAVSGRPPKFSADDAVRVALDLGIADFTMSGVAQRLGVTTPAIYRLFPGRDALVAACITAVTRDLPATPVDLDWREYLIALADLQWTTFLRYPGLTRVTADLPRSAGQAFDPQRTVFARMRDYGFSTSQAVFALHYVTDLTTAAIGHLHRQLAEFTRDAGSPDARVFSADGGRIITDAEDLTESFRRQCRLTVDFFLDHLAAVAPDFPEMTGPVGIPTDGGTDR